MLESNRIILKPLDELDSMEIVRWRNTKYVLDNVFSDQGPTVEEHRKWFEKYSSSVDRVEFVIIVKEINRKIGTIGLSSIDPKDQNAEYGILIGEVDMIGKGYAKEASELLIEYGFNQLNLQRIYLNVFEDNANAINLYNKLHFTVEGILRKSKNKKGIFKNVVVMSILKEEWGSLNN